MNAKRIAIAATIGLLCGLFCAYGTIMIAESKPELVITTGLLALIVYNRILIGLFVGVGDNITLHPVIRGALLGAIISLTIAIMPMIDRSLTDGLTLIAFGVVYGIIADFVATKFS
ncbi:MAG: hypothetical protein OCU20_03935 [Methanophagales archaeon]|nr:hypothetical protein [Methanophagales archaeon]